MGRPDGTPGNEVMMTCAAEQLEARGMPDVAALLRHLLDGVASLESAVEDLHRQSGDYAESSDLDAVGSRLEDMESAVDELQVACEQADFQQSLQDQIDWLAGDVERLENEIG